MAKLEVEFGADLSQLKNKLAEAQVLLENLKKQKSADFKLGLDTVNLQKQINDAKANISSLTKQINTNSSAFDTHSKAASNGGNTLIQFSRIAQDAPYGIIGIGNNLTATAESFGYLAKSSGGAGNALKAIGTSIMGTGGVLLAVSLATAAFTYMSQNGLSLGDVINKLRGNFDEFTASMQEANAEAAKNSAEEVSSLNALASVSQDVSLSMRDRMTAVNELQSTYPAYFGNLTKEQILNGDLKGIIDSVTDALLAKAKAAAYSSRISKLAEEEINITEKITKAKNDLRDAEKEAGKQRSNTAMAYSSGGVGAALGASANQVNNYRQSIYDLEASLKQNIKTQRQYQSEVNKQTANSIRLEEKAPKQPKVVKAKKEAFKKDTEFDNNAEAAMQGRYDIELGIIKRGEDAKYKEMLKGQQAQQGLADQTSRIALAGAAAEEAARLKTIEGLRSDLAVEMILLKSHLDNKLITQQQYDLMAKEQRLKSIEAQRALVPEHQIISDAIVGTIQNMGTALGEALANGANVAQSMGNALLQGLGGLLAAMGDHLIKIGTAAVLAGTVMKLFGTVTGVGAGLAAIAGGVLLKGIGGAIAAKGNKKTAGGSNGNDGMTNQRGSVSTGADVSSPTSSVSGGGTFNSSGGTVVFEIAGQKLIGVLNNTMQGNLRLGGSGLAG